MGESAQSSQEIDRESRGDFVIRFFDKIHLEQSFGTPDQAVETLKHMTFEEFRDSLIRINGILRGTPVSDRAPDGVKVRIDGFVTQAGFPNFEDKMDLLKYAFEKAQTLENGADVGLLLSTAISGIHLFNEANGRSSRLIHLLFANGYSGSPEDQKRFQLIIGDDGRDFFNSHVGLVEHETNPILQRQLGIDKSDPSAPLWSFWEKDDDDSIQKVFHEPLSEKELDALKVITKEDRKIGYLAVLQFLQNHNKSFEPYLVFPRVGKGRPALSLSKLMPECTHQDVQEIIEFGRRARIKEVQMVMDALSEPDKHLTYDGSKTIKQELVDQIKSIRELKKRGNEEHWFDVPLPYQ